MERVNQAEVTKEMILNNRYLLVKTENGAKLNIYMCNGRIRCTRNDSLNFCKIPKWIKELVVA